MRTKIVLTFVVLAALLQPAWGQPDFGKLPDILNMEKARITDFTLDGRRIDGKQFKENASRLKSGIYIFNGKKLLVK